jgi:ubiquinone/menaquinone biosynthesis C-methylase UbiE
MAAPGRLVDRVLGDGSLSLFNAGASIYDLLTAQRYWREQIASVLAHVDRPRPLRVLDLGCGPGVSTFVLAERLGEGSELLGVDLAHEMVARARRHHQRCHASLSTVRFEQADATALP